ncbi:MAG: hypothetical protein ACTSYI_12005 [Promethearchaeota archaeon]
MSELIICDYNSGHSAGHVDEIAKLINSRNIPPVILLSSCHFPTTTQVQAIMEKTKMNIFCYALDGKCTYKDSKKCPLHENCTENDFPKRSLELALIEGMDWVESLKE